MDKQRPTYSLLYFTAKWNPIIPKIEKDYQKFTSEYSKFIHYRVDCDEFPLIKQYFDCRVEPQFIILINGQELRRVIGYNFLRLGSFLEQATELHERDFNYLGNS